MERTLKLPVLNSLWVGDHTSLRRAAQRDGVGARAHGHEFQIFSYSPGALQGVPDGVEVLDASRNHA